MRILRTLILALSMLGAGCASAASRAEVEQAIATANALHQRSLRIENGWVETGRQLAAARAALDAGDLDAAEAAAERAAALARAALAQAERERDHWREHFLQ